MICFGRRCGVSDRRGVFLCIKESKSGEFAIDKRDCINYNYIQ